MKKITLISLSTSLLTTFFLFSFSSYAEVRWVKIPAHTKEERTAIANKGVAIEQVGPDYVVALVEEELLKTIKKSFRVSVEFPLTEVSKLPFKTQDFPRKDSNYHNYSEIEEFISELVSENKDIVSSHVIGKSLENRNIYHLIFSTDQKESHKKPGIVIMGGHHAREHLSVEMGIELAKYLASEFRNNNPEIVDLLESRQIHIIPLVNPDGAEYDISSGSYKSWRKNLRKNKDFSLGVDLNRNYSYKWGTGGSSKNPKSPIYMGEKPFSEPETQAIKDFIESHENITICLSIHTFSKLILYPWGHTYTPISKARDLSVHRTMAEKMASWNGYRPMQSSGLYITSGDTTDWSYGVHNIISFTFELDPQSMWDGGFYPGDIIQSTFQKNLRPFLYLIEYADNPYRVLNKPRFETFSFNSL